VVRQSGHRNIVKAQTRPPLLVYIETDIMGSCGSKQKKVEASTVVAGSSGAGSSSSSKPNQQSNTVGRERDDQEDIDAVRYLRKQKESPTKVLRGTQ